MTRQAQNCDFRIILQLIKIQKYKFVNLIRDL
jgi:hypothetical protein